MRAHEFLFERQISQSSAKSVPGYVAEIVRVLKAAEDPDIMLELQLSSKTPGPGDLIPFQPNPNQGEILEKAWAKIYAAPATPDKYPEWYEIMKHVIEGTIPGNLAQYNWPAQMAKPTDQKFKVPIGQLSKTPDLKGASKSYNTGNVTEGIFAGALYLRLNQKENITTPQLIEWLVNVPQNKITYPTEYKSAKTNYDNIEQDDQDFLFVKIHLSQNNFDALKDKPTLDGLMGHINSVTNYVNQVEVPRLRETFINDVVERIEIKAEGPVDEKASTVDIDIHVTNTETEETNLITFERSVKGGATSVKQFDQKTAGGAKKYGYTGDDKLISAKDIKAVGGVNSEKGMKMLADRRWTLVEQFWHSWSTDINMKPVKKKFTDVWMNSLRNGDADMSYLDSYWISYEHAAKELKKLLNVSKSRDATTVNKWIEKFYGDLHSHAGKTGREGALARMTSFHGGKYEELDFGELKKYVGNADITAELSKDLIWSDAAQKRYAKSKDPKDAQQQRARPEIHIKTAKAGEIVLSKETGQIVPKKQIPKMKEGTTHTVSWEAGEVFLVFRFFAAYGKLSNLIEKGDLLKKWAWVASSDSSGSPTDAMGVVQQAPDEIEADA